MHRQDMDPQTNATETEGGTMEPAAIDKSLDEPDATDAQNIGPILDRLKRIEGQVRGVQKMIVTGADCEAILTQVMAARAALERTAAQIVMANLEKCFDAQSPAEARRKVVRTVQLLSRST
jgi:DNA-binding FrmR family transcriptional regulator